MPARAAGESRPAGAANRPPATRAGPNDPGERVGPDFRANDSWTQFLQPHAGWNPRPAGRHESEPTMTAGPSIANSMPRVRLTRVSRAGGRVRPRPDGPLRTSVCPPTRRTAGRNYFVNPPGGPVPALEGRECQGRGDQGAETQPEGRAAGPPHGGPMPARRGRRGDEFQLAARTGGGAAELAAVHGTVMSAARTGGVRHGRGPPGVRGVPPLQPAGRGAVKDFVGFGEGICVGGEFVGNPLKQADTVF